LPDSAILDLSRLREAFEDDDAGIIELLEMALGTGAKHVTSLSEALAAHDLPGVARAAHGIKGSASNIGAVAITRISAEIEDRARTGRSDGMSELSAQLDAAYAALRETVREYRAEAL
jgi:HPt (histidine-containing phosphotransfer) domain-containing protein